MNDLANKKCVPCRIGTKPMDIKEAKKYLPSIPDWMLYGDKIIRQFEFKNFIQSMNFVNKVAQIAEDEGHHPDIFVSYNKVKLELTTHNANGLTMNDFVMAAKIDEIEKK